MADINFIKRLFEYDKEHMKEDVLKKVKKYIDHKDFVPAVRSFPVTMMYATNSPHAHSTEIRESLQGGQVGKHVGHCHG